MNAMNAAPPIDVPAPAHAASWALTPTRLVSAFAAFSALVVVVLWGAIAMQGPTNPFGPPQGGGYGAPPENPYGGPAPGPREAPPPGEPSAPPPEPPTGSGGSGSSLCSGSDCDACGPCGEVLGSIACDGLCEVLSLCEIFSACSRAPARVGFVGLALAELLAPVAVLAAWRKRERRREASA